MTRQLLAALVPAAQRAPRAGPAALVPATLRLLARVCGCLSQRRCGSSRGPGGVSALGSSRRRDKLLARARRLWVLVTAGLGLRRPLPRCPRTALPPVPTDGDSAKEGGCDARKSRRREGDGEGATTFVGRREGVGGTAKRMPSATSWAKNASDGGGIPSEIAWRGF